MYQTHVKILRQSKKPSNKDSSNLTGTTEVNILTANSLLQKVNFTNSGQNEIDLKEILNSFWLSTELDDIDVSRTENPIRLNTELKQTTEKRSKSKRAGFVARMSTKCFKNSKGHPMRQVISYVQIKYHMKSLNRKLSYYHFHLSSCSELLRSTLFTYIVMVDKRTDSSENLSASNSRCSTHFIFMCCLSEAVKKIKTCDNSLCAYKLD